ncbi:hypothetical protein JCM1840_002690 [Sporobolomyces johnsonii]
MQSEGDGDASFAGYASTSLSTREPLRPSPPHPLLAPLNSLLAVLLIPLTLTSLSLATPSLLLNVLEALLETRLEDVPDELRGSWERSKRIRVAEVLVEAVAEVLDGLARAKGVAGKAHWRRGDVEVKQVVRGVESELAKLVEGLLQIAEGMGVLSHGDEEPSPSLAEGQHDDPFYSIAVPNSSSSTLPPRFPLFTSTTPFNPSSTPTRSILFAPRPLRQPISHSPPVTAPLRATSSQLPPRPPPRASSSASSSSSVQTATSRSTSLTIPSRPSLVSELSKSGSLSPPPQSPRTSSGRSTLRLMQRRLEEQESTPIAPLSFHVEVQQAASRRPQERPVRPTPRRPEVLASDSGDLEEDAESFFEPPTSTPVAPIRPTRASQPIVAAAKISKKGKERAVVDAASETPDSHECVCCDGSHTINPSASSHSVLPAAAPPPSSPPARRVRIVRTAALATEEAGDLSVHGDSEIEAFEAARRGTARPLSPAPPATPAAPEPTPLASVVTTATPSPYTMLLLAQRARLAEKLRALQLRERDRREAEGRLATAA